MPSFPLPDVQVEFILLTEALGYLCFDEINIKLNPKMRVELLSNSWLGQNWQNYSYISLKQYYYSHIQQIIWYHLVIC